MFERIELTNCFVHKNLTLDFKTGVTNISGLNGTGKTLIVEMMEFGLWGTAALRGLSSDEGYKKMSIALNFKLKSKRYRVERTISSATLFEEGVKIVTGVKPVNAKIIELFGYSYDVYRITNVARQGEIERMGLMKPTERKAMVDETIGLAKIDALADWVGKQFTESSAQVRALEAVLTPPEPLPEPPAPVEAEVISLLQTQIATVKQHAPFLTAPEEVTPHPQFSTLETLRGQQMARAQAMSEIKGLTSAIDSFPPLPEAPKVERTSQEEYQRLKEETAAYNQAVAQKATIERALLSFSKSSTYTDEQLQEARKVIELRKRWAKKQELLKKQTEYVCPACDHHWHDVNPLLAEYDDVPEQEPEALIPLPRIEVEEKINAYQETKKTLQTGLDAIVLGSEHSARISLMEANFAAWDKYSERLSQESHRLELLQKRAKIVVGEDVNALITEIGVTQKNYETYLGVLKRHLEAKAAVSELESLGVLQERLQTAQEGREAHLKFEVLKAEFHRIQTKYQKDLVALEEYRSVSLDWKRTREAISLLRTRIKGYLLPSLNEVSSKLLSKMSNGWLNWVVVNDDFDITVEAKNITLLSGAGKALTNLALRIGLGQVLTNSVFSVLTLDESDAGVDTEKAPMVSQALQALTGTISQIIVISHKQGLTSDHRIEL